MNSNILRAAIAAAALSAALLTPNAAQAAAAPGAPANCNRQAERLLTAEDAMAKLPSVRDDAGVKAAGLKAAKADHAWQDARYAVEEALDNGVGGDELAALKAEVRHTSDALDAAYAEERAALDKAGKSHAAAKKEVTNAKRALTRCLKKHG
ncbi:hypothetical protein [Streptomyces sp. NPDC087300]|uniref:hypothetical protein n=1 Tax=Streptomyces sp. NPDC087300 TaxID=3365780 RepID=UPI003828ECA9